MSLEACQKLVARADPERFAAISHMPEAVLSRLLPILAFNIEVSRAPWVTEEAMIAEMRLQWWRDALDEIAQGKIVRNHEVAVPLAMALSPELAVQLDQLVAARRWDIYRDPFEDAAHQDEYLRNTGGLLMWAMAASLGATQEQASIQFGTSVGAAGFLRAAPELEARGRQPLLEASPNGRAAFAQKGLAMMNATARSHDQIDAKALPALLTGWWARPILEAVAKDGSDLVPMSEFRKRARLAKLSLFGWWR